MQLTEEQVRLIFGLKLTQLRTEKDLSLFGLSKITGLSKSYLNEIEKGKKYPKPDKVVAIAEALEVPYDEMVSMKLLGPMAPLVDIIKSGILKEIPLELFGIEEGNLIDIIANAPERVTAFIGTIFEISRHYNITRESFYLSALRSYQESHENYFPDIEKEVLKCAKRYQIDLKHKITSKELEEILVQEFEYGIDYEALTEEDYPQEIRSVFVPSRNRLLIGKSVSETQRVFILAKELGYAYMGIKERPLTFSWIKFKVFEEVLNNFKASYFAGALILPEERLSKDLNTFFKKKKWKGKDFLAMLHEYTDSAETFFQRLTNVLPKHLGFSHMYFLRFAHNAEVTLPYLTKELHLTKKHYPTSMQNQEHYCQRWISADILLHSQNYPELNGTRAAAQISHSGDEKDGYLVITSSNVDPFNPERSRSVCIGIELNRKQSKKIGFVKDSNIQKREVGITCERCAIQDCKERVAEPTILRKRQRTKEIENRVYSLIDPAE